MSRAAFGGALLVLEGDDDIRFWRAHTAGSSLCQFVVAGSKDTVKGAVVKANLQDQIGILGIVDDDYDSLLGKTLPANVLATDARDLEIMLLGSPAFAKVISEVADANKIQQIQAAENQCIFDCLTSRAISFGKLRLLNDMHGWKVDFDKLSPWKFIDHVTWTLDQNLLTQEFCNQLTGITPVQFGGHLQLLPNHPICSVVQGKDTLSILAIGLQKTIGACQISQKTLVQMLRLAFDKASFAATKLYAGIKAWQLANPPFVVLAS